MMYKRFYAFVLLLVAHAAAAQDKGLGFVADNLMVPLGMASDFVYSACLIIGGSFLFASVIKYAEHRRSPLMVPISTVVFLFLAGGVLVAIPVVSYLYHYGFPYSLFGYPR